MLRMLAVALVALVSLASLPSAARAQDWPTKPVRLVVPFPPGGGADIVTRAIGARLQARLNQPFVIENAPGAGGLIGTQKVARSAPDGYTFVIGITNTFGINATFYSQLPYDPIRDFQHVALLAVGPHVLVINPETPAGTLGEYVDYVKKNPGKLSYASYGNGSTSHLISEMLKKQTGMDLTHVPYKGMPPALADVMGKAVSMLVSSTAPAVPLIQGKKLRALAIMGDRRLDSLPDVPTMAELGYAGDLAFKGATLTLWYGMHAPAGTPMAIAEKFNSELRAVVADREVAEVFAKAGLYASPMSIDQFNGFVKSEIDGWGRLVTASGAKAE